MGIVNCNELALKKVKVRGDVIGKFGMFEIEQKFLNNTPNILEVKYTFPILDTTTINGFEVIVGDKVLVGKSKDKESAKKEYQENIVRGNSAYLMEQKSKNIFDINIGKILSNEEVIVKIKYIDKFEIVDNKINIVIPTLVAPKYKSEITQKLVYADPQYTVDFNINIDKSINRKSIECISHNITIVDDENFEVVKILDQDLNKDFKMNIELKNELSSKAIIQKGQNGNEYLYMTFMPEITEHYEDTEKEYVFLIDVSGSMGGIKIEETKRAVIECLRNLDEGDRFNIVAFNSTFEAMSIKSLKYNDENIDRAVRYVNSLSAYGGTEILDPVKFALYEKDVEKVVLLFTDGQVGNENEIIQFVRENINYGRLFAFGIDSNVNSSFIRELSKVGNGKSEFIMPKERIDEKIIRTFSRIQTPLLKNVKVEYGKNILNDEIKEENVLFNYEFFNVFSEIKELVDDIKLTGEILNKKYEWVIKKDEILSSKVDLEILFAKEKIERYNSYYKMNLDEGYKKLIIELAEKYNINSEFTSFITVNEREDKAFEIPVFQNTTLNVPIDSDPWHLKMKCADTSPSYSTSRELDIPTFLRKNKTTNSTNNETNKNISALKVEKVKPKTVNDEIYEVYNKFIKQENKDIELYLLFVVYLLNKNFKFNYTDFLKFIQKNIDNIHDNIEYLNLVYLCYNFLSSNRYIDKKETYELLSDDYKKALDTNLNLKFFYKRTLDEENIKEIIALGKLEENIKEVLKNLI